MKSWIPFTAKLSTNTAQIAYLYPIFGIVSKRYVIKKDSEQENYTTKSVKMIYITQLSCNIYAKTTLNMSIKY